MSLSFQIMVSRWIGLVVFVLMVAFLQQATTASVRNVTRTAIKPALNNSRSYEKVTSTTTEVMPNELNLEDLTEESDPTSNAHRKRQANYGRFFIMDPRQMQPYIQHKADPSVRLKKEVKNYPNVKCSNCLTNTDNPNPNCPNCQANPSYPNPSCQANTTLSERRKGGCSRKSSSYLTTFLMRQLKDTNNNMNRLLDWLAKNYPGCPLSAPRTPIVSPVEEYEQEAESNYNTPAPPPVRSYRLVSPWRSGNKVDRPYSTVADLYGNADQDAEEDYVEADDEDVDHQKPVRSEELDTNRYSSAKRFPSESVELEEDALSAEKIPNTVIKKCRKQQVPQIPAAAALRSSSRASKSKKACANCNDGRRCLLCHQNVPTFDEGR